LLENEDKRLKDKESELRHWEKVLKKEVKRRLSSDGSLPAELRGIPLNLLSPLTPSVSPPSPFLFLFFIF
jgi:hypothetical protein